MSTDEIQELKDQEKAAFEDFQAADAWKDNEKDDEKYDKYEDRPREAYPAFWIGMSLLAAGVIALLVMNFAVGFEGAEGTRYHGGIFHFWWLIFFIKPFFFGWGWGHRGHHGRRGYRRC